MNNRWRQLAVVLVFLALPLQGVAATIHALSCLSGSADQRATHSQTQGHDGESHGSSDDHDGESGKSDSAQFCCHLAAPGMLAVPTAAIQAQPPVVESPISLLATLFIPEGPQRPPRS